MNCPVCVSKIVPPAGEKDSRVLFVGEFPGEIEIKYGKPFSGPTGKIFRKEFMKTIGQDLWMFRICNLWLHEPNKDENCLSVGHDLVLEEAGEKDVIVLIGSDAVSHFSGFSVSDVTGLTVPSEYFHDKEVFCMINPAQVFHKGTGELNFALHNLKILLDERGIL